VRLVKAIVPGVMALVLTAMPVMADVVAVVSSKSTVTTLSKTQITDIFLGKTSHFPDGSRAVPIDQNEGTLARDLFYSTFTGESAAQLKAHWAKIIFTGRGQPPKALPNSAAVKTLVAENPAAIGYIEEIFVDETLRVVKVIGQ
jgi:ABC-type phosphate transport system substrate-binding protein